MSNITSGPLVYFDPLLTFLGSDSCSRIIVIPLSELKEAQSRSLQSFVELLALAGAGWFAGERLNALIPMHSPVQIAMVSLALGVFMGPLSILSILALVRRFGRVERRMVVDGGHYGRQYLSLQLPVIGQTLVMMTYFVAVWRGPKILMPIAICCGGVFGAALLLFVLDFARGWLRGAT